MWDDSDDVLPEDPGVIRRLNVLYLVAELESAIDRGGIAWNTNDAERLPPEARQRVICTSAAGRQLEPPAASRVGRCHPLTSAPRGAVSGAA
jgi:hypothetical protein